MSTVIIDEAEAKLADLIARAEAGEEVIIARAQKPVARLTGFGQIKRKLEFGMFAGRFADIPDSFFFDPLPEDELRAWEGDTEDSTR